MAYGRFNKDTSPCDGCTERYLACHSTCKRYDTWSKNKREKNRKISESLNPKHSHYFKEHSQSKLAPKSKKRYR